jgi:type IV pilus biogenesis protein CpaD/CtpE
MTNAPGIGTRICAVLLAILLTGCASGAGRVALSTDSTEPAQPPCPAANVSPGPPLDTFPTDGCWNDANLAKMVADPRDLVRGRTLAPASGPREALAVEAYQRGQTKPLAGEDTAGGPTQSLGAVGTTGP